MSTFDLAAYVKRSEGLRLAAYDDKTGEALPAGAVPVGTATIGWGHTGPGVVPGLVITDAEAEAYFARDLATAVHGAALDLGQQCWARLDPCRRGALADMCFELGAARLLGFERMIAAVRRFDWPNAAAECLASRYEHQAEARAKRNAHMLLTGAEPPADLW